MLEAINLHKSFGQIQAVRGLSFVVEKGEILGCMGPNGAGKSTTMRMITGFLPPSAGTAKVCGHDVQTDPVAAKSMMGYLPESAPVYRDMTVSGFLHFVARIRGYCKALAKDKVEAVMRKCYLEDVRYQSIDTLSKGFRQRVCCAQAVLHDPPVLVMDEPTDGLDPNQKRLVRNMIREMASEKAIVVSTHILEEIDALCTRAIIIARGVVVANGTPAELKAKSPTGRLDDMFWELTMGPESPARAPAGQDRGHACVQRGG